MARKYLFICDGGCRTAVERDSESLPEGWAIITAAAGAFDVCSLACAARVARGLELPDRPTPAPPPAQLAVDGDT